MSTVSEATQTVAAALVQCVARHGERTAYIDRERRWSWREVEAAASTLAANWRACGVGRGDRIAIILPNCLEWVEAYFAAAMIGAVIVGLNVRYRDSELDYMLADSRVKAVLAPARYGDFDYRRYVEQAKERIPSLTKSWFVDDATLPPEQDFDRLLQPGAASADAADASVQPDDLLMIIYTSGTTGRSKAAGLTHRSQLASAWAQCAHTRMTESDLVQLAMPLNHVGGITCGVLTYMLAGATCELVEVFKPDLVLAMMQRHPPTAVVGVPTMHTLMLMAPGFQAVGLGRVRLVIVGGSNAEPDLLARMHQAYPNATVMNLYGMSETSGANIMTSWEADAQELSRSIGRPLAGMQVRVLDPDGQPLPAGEIGELAYRGASVVPGYVGAVGDPQAFTADGWLRSGDLGRIDDTGLIELKGRRKDMYIQGGYNVYPSEVEGVIGALPDVVMVAGIGVPDPVLGEIGRYYVVRKPGSSLQEDEVLARCSEHLADYKVPRQIVFRDALPMTPAGKIQKAALRAELQAGDGEGGA